MVIPRILIYDHPFPIRSYLGFTTTPVTHRVFHRHPCRSRLAPQRVWGSRLSLMPVLSTRKTYSSQAHVRRLAKARPKGTLLKRGKTVENATLSADVGSDDEHMTPVRLWNEAEARRRAAEKTFWLPHEILRPGQEDVWTGIDDSKIAFGHRLQEWAWMSLRHLMRASASGATPPPPRRSRPIRCTFSRFGALVG